MLDAAFKNRFNEYFGSPLKKIVVAVSGGADSMCLAHLAKTNLPDTQIIAVIVDHGLREESAAEAKLVSKNLSNLGIKNHILRWQEKKPTANIQEKARIARYKILTDFCLQQQIPALFVAHNLNDQAETVMLRIMRGSGVDGISGISRFIEFRGIKIFRPLLDILRSDIESYLLQNNIPWVKDPSNENDKYDRVKIRKYVNALPDSVMWIHRLALLATNAQRSANYINSQLEETFAKLVKFEKLGYASIDYISFCDLHDEIALKLIVKIINLYSPDGHQPRLKSLENTLHKLKNKKDTALGGIEFKIKNNQIFCIREFKAISNIIIDGIWDYRIKIETKDANLKPLGKDGWQQIKGQISEKEWPHINVVYCLPAFFKNSKVISCPLLGYSDC